MGKFGTLSVLEDLAARSDMAAGNEDELTKRFSEALIVHNDMFTDMVSSMASMTSNAQVPYGGADPAIIQELDEWGAADASKPTMFGNMGLPLRIYQGTAQWTRSYFETATVGQMAAALDSFALADIQMFQKVIRKVLFTNTQTSNYVDRLQSKLTYNLKPLLNADGQSIPTSPSGATFTGGSHTHFMANATLTVAYLNGLIDNVAEHGVDGQMMLYIAKGNEATVTGLTGFSPYIDARVTVVGAASVGNQSLDTTSPDDRAIGVFGGAEVWVKPWVPENYQVAVDVGGANKPLAIRTRSGDLTGTGAFRILAEHEHAPLRAQHVGREYGVGVVGRHKAAVGRSNDASYAVPSGL